MQNLFFRVSTSPDIVLPNVGLPQYVLIRAIRKILERTEFDRQSFTPKKPEDVLGGAEAWENVEKTEGGPKSPQLGWNCFQNLCRLSTQIHIDYYFIDHLFTTAAI